MAAARLHERLSHGEFLQACGNTIAGTAATRGPKHPEAWQSRIVDGSCRETGGTGNLMPVSANLTLLPADLTAV